GRARLPTARRQLPAVGHRSLPAQPELRQRRRRRQAAGTSVADDGGGGQALPSWPRYLGVGQQRPGRRARCRDGLLRRRADLGDPGRRRPPAKARARSEGPSHQCRQSDEAAAVERTPARPLGPRFRRAVHRRQADHLRLPRLPVTYSPADLPANGSREHPRARLQGRGHHHDAVRYVRAERSRSLPPRKRCDRPRAEARGAGRLRQAGDPRQAHRPQRVHRPVRRRYARDHRLAVGAGSGFRWGAFHGGRQRLTRAEANVNVFAIRHGETAWSLTGQHTGRTDIPLTDNTPRLPPPIRPVLTRNAFQLVLGSPMQRARETCELAGLGDKAVIDSDLVEWNYGEYEGLTPKQICEVAPGWLIFHDGCPGGEAPEQVGARVDRVIAR